MFSVAFIFLSMTVVVRRRIFCCVREQFIKALGFLYACDGVKLFEFD